MEIEITVSNNEGNAFAITLRELEALAHPLAQKFYKANGHNSKTNRNDKIFACLYKGSLVGCLRLAPCDTERLLRGVFISPSFRGMGLGRKLIQHALSNARFKTVWTFPYSHLTLFYKALGFSEQNVAQTPSAIEAALLSYQKQGRDICVMAWQQDTN